MPRALTEGNTVRGRSVEQLTLQDLTTQKYIQKFLAGALIFLSGQLICVLNLRELKVIFTLCIEKRNFEAILGFKKNQKQLYSKALQPLKCNISSSFTRRWLKACQPPVQGVPFHSSLLRRETIPLYALLQFCHSDLRKIIASIRNKHADSCRFCMEHWAEE